MGFNNLVNPLRKLNTEQKCIDYLAELRWGDNVICPYCNGSKINRLKSRPMWWCGNCRKQFSVKLGTAFEGSKIPLNKWFAAIWLHVNYKKDVNSYQLGRDLGVTQKTAWFILGRLGEIMPKLSDGGGLFGVLEVNDTYIGDKETYKHYSKRVKGTQGCGSGKTEDTVIDTNGRSDEIRAFKVPNLRGDLVQVVVSGHVYKGSQLSTDEFTEYRAVAHEGYIHSTGDHGGGGYARNSVHTSSTEGAWAQFKRGIGEVDHHYSNTAQTPDNRQLHNAPQKSVGLQLAYKGLVA